MEIPTSEWTKKELTGDFTPSTQEGRDRLMAVLWAYADKRLVDREALDYEAAGHVADAGRLVLELTGVELAEGRPVGVLTKGKD